MAYEKYIKPVTSALTSSSYSLTPTPDPQNRLVLQVPIPPTTAESRQLAAQEAKKITEKASLDVRTARGDAQKRFRKMELGKKARWKRPPSPSLPLQSFPQGVFQLSADFPPPFPSQQVIRDELRKAHDQMEKVAKKGQEEVQKLYEAAIKGLER